MEKAKIPGLAALIMKDGEISWTGRYGLANIDEGREVMEETFFMIASCSKTVTATAIMLLYEDRLIDLDDAINTYLPFDLTNPHFPEDDITIRMLLTHTSSLLDDWDVLDPLYTIESGGGDSHISLEEFIYDYFHPNGDYYSEKNNFQQRKAPGTDYEYCNMNFALLGYLLELACGQPFDLYCEENIFTPLEMDETSWFLKDVDVSKLAMPYSVENDTFIPVGHYGFPDYPDGQIRTNVLEFANFVSVFLNDGLYRGESFLKTETVEEFLSIQFPKAAPHQAIAWNYDEFESFFVRSFLGYKPAHTGGDPGVATITVMDPNKKAAVIIFANGISGHFLSAKAYYFDILKALCKKAGITRN